MPGAAPDVTFTLESKNNFSTDTFLDCVENVMECMRRCSNVGMTADALGIACMNLIVARHLMQQSAKRSARRCAAKRRKVSQAQQPTKLSKRRCEAIGVMCSKFVSDHFMRFSTKESRTNPVVKREEKMLFKGMQYSIGKMDLFQEVQHRVLNRLPKHHAMTVREVLGCGFLCADACMVLLRSTGLHMETESIVSFCETACCAWMGISFARVHEGAAKIAHHMCNALATGTVYGYVYEERRTQFVGQTGRAMWFLVNLHINRTSSHRTSR